MRSVPPAARRRPFPFDQVPMHVECPCMKSMGGAGGAPSPLGTAAPAVGRSGSGGGIPCLRQRGRARPMAQNFYLTPQTCPKTLSTVFAQSFECTALFNRVVLSKGRRRDIQVRIVATGTARQIRAHSQIFTSLHSFYLSISCNFFALYFFFLLPLILQISCLRILLEQIQRLSSSDRLATLFASILNKIFVHKLLLTNP